MRRELKFGLAGVLGQGLMGGLFATTRTTKIGTEYFRRFRDEGRPVVFVLWHGQLLPLVYHHQQEGVVVLVSEHTDGEYVTRVLHRYGFETARGSSTRGGTKGLRGLVRALKDGKDVAITPDGPKGPARVVKPGALVAAQLAQAPIIPVGMGSDAAWSFASWDAFQVPKPLSRLGIVYGEPIMVPRDADEAGLETLAGELGTVLDDLTRRATLEVGGDPDAGVDAPRAADPDGRGTGDGAGGRAP